MAVNDFYPNNSGYGQETFARNAPTETDAKVLAADTPEVVTIPADVKTVVFSSTANFYAKIDAAGAVPAADVDDGTASELNPSVWYINGNTTIGIESPTSCVVTLSFYK